MFFRIAPSDMIWNIVANSNKFLQYNIFQFSKLSGIFHFNNFFNHFWSWVDVVWHLSMILKWNSSFRLPVWEQNDYADQGKEEIVENKSGRVPENLHNFTKFVCEPKLKLSFCGRTFLKFLFKKFLNFYILILVNMFRGFWGHL